ncbi:major histocompatibility complex class I-related gene protein-like [Eublepharis macularius]|uniref:Major histocompatibility complex class I-related gene protein-like n=1 Tax=Eublepharis macularius TaxID=481883 RepID=A0AA97J5Y7_EUBMA|nr:major histocompatibility complex class I-related gene protein-like [Eublepharis macularius]
MTHLWRGSLLLVAAAFLLEGCFGSSWHSLRYFYTTIWDPVRDVSDFIAVIYVDDLFVGYYNSTMKRVVPQVSRIRKVEEDNPHFLDRYTNLAMLDELRQKMHLKDQRHLYNQSRGLHTWQCTFGCELSQDRYKRGFSHIGYNGEDYLSFDKETLTWTAATVPAQVTKRKWDANLARNRYIKSYLEEVCIEWLQKFLDYGEESLLWREPPTVRVTLKASYDGLETLVCRAHGFYPKEIDATWRKDGEVWEQETFRGGVVPNSDGTYHTWLSVKIHPEDRFRYQCHVEHDGLPEPLDVAWEEPGKRRGSYQAAHKAPSNL